MFTKSTEFYDQEITNEHCCEAAVADTRITEDMYDDWCLVSTKPSIDAILNFERSSKICTMVSGSILTVYKDANLFEQYSSTGAPKTFELVANSLCCQFYEYRHIFGYDRNLMYAC